MISVEELKPMAYVGQFDDAEEDHSDKFQNSEPIMKLENCDNETAAATSRLPVPQNEYNDHSYDVDDTNDAAVEYPEDEDDFDYDEDYDSYDFCDNFYGIAGSRREIFSGPSITKFSKRKMRSIEDNLTNGKICTEMYHNNQYGGKALRGVANLESANRNQLKDKSDTATKDSVLDRNTMLYMSKMIYNEDIECVEGCIATGKEANVYYCSSKCTAFSGVPGKVIACALKVHKTCIATFKRRQEYNEKNPHSKRVTTGDLKGHIVKWCEAEANNLRKMAEAGIPCPKVYSRCEHLLLMEHIGVLGLAAPRLHNSIMSPDLACVVYGKVIRYMRTMYWKCNMVHADLSEYNIILIDDKPYIIDLSQAVPRGHPNSFKHLRQDCTNITEFFRKMGVSTMMVQELFFFIVDMTITDDNVESYLDECLEICTQRNPNEMTNEEIVTENVFKKIFLPMTLNEVEYFERDYELIKAGLKSAADMPSLTILGLKLNNEMSGVREEPQLLTDKRAKVAFRGIDEVVSNNEDEEPTVNEVNANVDEEDRDSVESKGPNILKHPDRPKKETAEEKRDRKKGVKQMQAAKREKKKMSKNEKKICVKNSKKK